MFPANDRNVQAHRAGWLGRIMTAEQRHLEMPTLDHRVFTPLRPNAGMANRVPTPTAAAGPGASGSRPSTQQGGARPSAVAAAAQQGPHSARNAVPTKLPALVGDTALSSQKGTPKKQQPPSSKAAPPKPLNSLAAVGVVGGADLSATQQSISASFLQSGENSPLRTTTEDPYTSHEAAVVDEINEMRRDPAGYSAYARQNLRVLRPFIVVPEDPTVPAPVPLNLAGLKALAADLAQQLDAAKTRLEDLKTNEEQAITAMREQWAVEDAERAKKKGKAPPPKKADKAASSTAGGNEERDVAADREAEIAALQERNATDRKDTRAAIVALTDASKRAAQGVKVVSSLVAKLGATPPLPPLEPNRGLALAARDLCDSEVSGSVGVDPTIYTNRFGGGEGPYGQCTALGRFDSAGETVLDLLLCLHDPGRRAGRQALLAPHMRYIGCGWRRNAVHGAATTVVVAGNFAEFASIAARAHLPLQDVRRTLPFAAKISTNTSVRLDAPVGSGVEVVHPVSHPVKTSSKAVRAVIRCPPDANICASVVAAGQPEPTHPAFAANATFVQRTADNSGVEVLASIPGDGVFHIVIYGQIPPPADGIGFAGTQTRRIFDGSFANTTLGTRVTPRGGAGASSSMMATTSVTAAGDSGPEAAIFRRLGVIIVMAEDTDPRMPPPVFPVATADFHDRRCRVDGPLSGYLLPNAPCVFRLGIPLTAYKAGEFHRIAASLESAQRKVDGSTAMTETLEGELAAATQRVAAAEETAAASAPALQQEIAALQRDMGKKKGKELDKAKTALSEAEDRLRALEAETADAVRAKADAEERLAAHRRGARQAAAMRLRYLADQEQLQALTDRSKPLDVEIAVEDRRARMPPVAGSNGTAYEVALRTPRAGSITIFVAGVPVLEYAVHPDTLDWPEEAFDDARWR